MTRAGGGVMDGERLIEEIARYAADKKAVDVVELDLRGVLGYTDYFLVCSGRTGRQAKAIHDGILEGLKHEHDVLPRRVEGSAERRLDPDGLPRRGGAHLHPREARLLPPGAALGRGAGEGRRDTPGASSRALLAGAVHPTANCGARS